MWSLHVRADGKALVSGSADKDVKFWEFNQKASNDGSVSPTFGNVFRVLNLEVDPERSDNDTDTHKDVKDDGRCSWRAV